MEPTTLDPRRWRALALLCGAFFMVVLDTGIVVVALPSIQADLGFAPDDLQWILSAYALTFGGLLLLGGRAADLLGRRRVFMMGLGLFTVASLLCGLAWSPGALVAARSIQGIGAAVMTPTALSIIVTIFPDGAERNKALGIWGSLGGIGGTTAWLVGGPLTDLGWGWIFIINVPFGATTLLLAPRLLPADRATGRGRSFDPLGALSATAAMVLLVYAVVEAPVIGWGEARTVGLFAASALLLALFAVVESRVKAPLLPLRLLRSRTLVGANAAMLLFSAAALGGPFLLTLYAQDVLGYSPVRFGLTSIVFPLGVVAGAIAGQALVLKLGYRATLAAGLTLIGLAFLYLTRVSPDGSYFGDIFFGLLLIGPGVGLTVVTCSIAALAGIHEREAGLASGLSNTALQIGAAIGTAVVSTVAVSRTNTVIAAGATDPAFALTEGLQAGFVACIVLSAVGLLVGFALIGGRRRAAAHAGTARSEPATDQPEIVSEAVRSAP